MMPNQVPDQADTKSDANASSENRWLVLVIRLGAFLCFAGWTWVHFYWEGPYGILIWQDSTFEIAQRWGVSWEEFVGTGGNDGLVQRWLARIGWLYLVCALLTLTVRRKAVFQMAGLLAGSGLLCILSYAKYVGAQRQLPMLVEHGGQALMPVLLVVAIAWGSRHRATIMVAMTAFVMTFAGHGSYAFGLWPTPATFHAMINVCLGVEFETSRAILRVAGLLDFAVCLGILVPLLRRWCAFYAVGWGFLTAIARPVAGMSWQLNYWGADQFLHEAVLRTPHFIIPLYLFLVWQKPQQDSTGSI